MTNWKNLLKDDAKNAHLARNLEYIVERIGKAYDLLKNPGTDFTIEDAQKEVLPILKEEMDMLERISEKLIQTLNPKFVNEKTQWGE